MNNPTPDPVSESNTRQSAFYASLGEGNDRPDITTGNGHPHTTTSTLAEAHAVQKPNWADLRRAIERTEVWRAFGFNIDPILDAILAVLPIPATAEPRHFAPYGSTNSVCDETVPRPTRWDAEKGEYDDSRFTTRRASTTCADCLRIIRIETPIPATGEEEWEYGWMADEDRRSQMTPRGPRLMLEDHPYTPEEIARFPKGNRVRRRRAGLWVEVTP